MAVSDALPDGRVAFLKALLADISSRYDEAEDPKDAKALAVEMRAIFAELDELVPPVIEKPKTVLDELRAKRESRKKTG